MILIIIQEQAEKKIHKRRVRENKYNKKAESKRKQKEWRGNNICTYTEKDKEKTRCTNK